MCFVRQPRRTCKLSLYVVVVVVVVVFNVNGGKILELEI